jgi:endonuclease/exonuclease/phosphatase family metal-dependent hydrolase
MAFNDTQYGDEMSHTTPKIATMNVFGKQFMLHQRVSLICSELAGMGVKLVGLQEMFYPMALTTAAKSMNRFRPLNPHEWILIVPKPVNNNVFDTYPLSAYGPVFTFCTLVLVLFYGSILSVASFHDNRSNYSGSAPGIVSGVIMLSEFSLNPTLRMLTLVPMVETLNSTNFSAVSLNITSNSPAHKEDNTFIFFMLSCLIVFGIACLVIVVVIGTFLLVYYTLTPQGVWVLYNRYMKRKGMMVSETIFSSSISSVSTSSFGSPEHLPLVLACDTIVQQLHSESGTDHASLDLSQLSPQSVCLERDSPPLITRCSRRHRTKQQWTRKALLRANVEEGVFDVPSMAPSNENCVLLPPQRSAKSLAHASIHLLEQDVVWSNATESCNRSGLAMFLRIGNTDPLFVQDGVVQTKVDVKEVSEVHAHFFPHKLRGYYPDSGQRWNVYANLRAWFCHVFLRPGFMVCVHDRPRLLTDTMTDKTIYINVHLVCGVSPSASTARVRQLHFMWNVIEEIGNKLRSDSLTGKISCVLMGDFNMDSDSLEFDYLNEELGFTDLNCVSSQGGHYNDPEVMPESANKPYYTYDSTINPHAHREMQSNLGQKQQRRIDYIFHKPLQVIEDDAYECIVVSHALLFKTPPYPSDHFGISVKLHNV